MVAHRETLCAALGDGSVGVIQSASAGVAGFDRETPSARVRGAG